MCYRAWLLPTHVLRTWLLLTHVLRCMLRANQHPAAVSKRLGCTKELQADCVKCITLMHHITNRMSEAKEVGRAAAGGKEAKEVEWQGGAFTCIGCLSPWTSFGVILVQFSS